MKNIIQLQIFGFQISSPCYSAHRLVSYYNPNIFFTWFILLILVLELVIWLEAPVSTIQISHGPLHGRKETIPLWVVKVMQLVEFIRANLDSSITNKEFINFQRASICSVVNG